jgi:hypothetical protein
MFWVGVSWIGKLYSVNFYFRKDRERLEMMLNVLWRDGNWRRLLLLNLLAAITLISSPLLAQTATVTGSIAGTVTSPSGTALAGATVTITGQNGKATTATTDSQGGYTVGNLAPGTYNVRTEASGFKPVQLAVDVKADNTANGNIKMSGEVQLNTEQPTVQGELTLSQIEDLPLNGRNSLSLAQFEPGVQIQDGQNFDPTKAGYQSISIGSRFGRTARIEVDGADVSDETVGTTTTTIPSSAVKEFQVSQSSLDVSTPLTSSGSVNISTKSGTDSLHGEAFGAFRDSSFSSELPAPPGVKTPFQRNAYGGAVGGAIVKDKAFFFADGERTVQHTQVPVVVGGPFSQYSGSYSDPFHEENLLGRLDYHFTGGARGFYRFSYFKNSSDSTSGLGYSVYDNVNITRSHVVGVDFDRWNLTNSIRFSFLKFENQMGDATIGNSALPFNDLHAQIAMGATGLVAGPNYLAPQGTPQRNIEIKYDGSRMWRNHAIRFGGSYNYIVGGGFASFYKNGPQLTSQVSQAEITGAAGGPYPGGASNPFNYPADSAVLANGLGYATSKSALGFPAGELGPDNRIQLYLGDSWKVHPDWALTFGLGYHRDTGRTDSQYAAIPQLNSLVAGLGDKVAQPNTNFAPQFGFAWNTGGSGKMVFRGGIGLFWENSLWNNVLFDAPYRQRTGAFLQSFSPCSAPGQPVTLQTSSGSLNTPGSPSAAAICGAPGATSFPLIGNALPSIIALQQAYVAGSPFNLNAPNAAFAGQYLNDCAGGTNCYFAPGNSMFNPAYRSPRSVQMNIGFQRELREGMVLSVDVVRNVETHYLLGVDQNYTGDVRYFDKGGAQAAIAKTLAACGAVTVPQSWALNCLFDPSTGTTDGGTWGTAVNPARPANMSDYASHGLGSSSDMGGHSCLAQLGYNCAFGGLNPLAPPLGFLSPVGRSVYNGVQVKLIDNVKHPFRGAESMNLQLSYSISRFSNSGGGVPPDGSVTASSGDQDFIAPALDNRDVNHYFGPSALDRRHQISFGSFINLPKRFQWGLIGHFDSPLSTTMTVPNTGAGAGEIFRTDFSGDGTTQDPIPGTHVGNFDRGVDANGLARVISRYNTTVAGLPTPAGQVLVTNNLMTQQDLINLGGVAPAVAPAPINQVDFSWLRSFDTSVSWNYTIKDRITIRPSVAVFNLLNFVNFDLPGNMMSGLLTGTSGAVNGTSYQGHATNRAGAGSGIFMLGSPRQIEFSLKVNF